MGVFTEAELACAEAIGRMSLCNPFLPERLEWERRVLGDAFVPGGVVWSAPGWETRSHPNLPGLQARGEKLVGDYQARVRRGASPAAADRSALAAAGRYVLYCRHEGPLRGLIQDAEAGRPGTHVPFYDAFARDCAVLLPPGDGGDGADGGPGHLFACFFQLRRAFHCIFGNILGQSLVTARLRAAVWQSIFTRDMARYRRSLFSRMGDIAVLIHGPSGTGKELVARAIAFSRYIPFDPEKREFAATWRDGFHALNMAALSPTLVESELFGHRRGAFTGALEDHRGWFEVCGRHGTVFLDEIAEVPPDVQAKLLRVLEARTFSRLGDTAVLPFDGKLVTATNHEMGTEMAGGRFRADLYYRLCADSIRTPSLQERVQSNPEELGTLVRFLAARVAGVDEADGLATEVMTWIERSLPKDYGWPGNVRELEQCVRNVMLRGTYAPATGKSRDEFWTQARQGRLTVDSLLAGYCRRVHGQLGSYEAAARSLGIDRRTVKAWAAKGTA